MKINFSKYFKISNILSVIFFAVSILFILFKGLNYGIDFKGGTLFEIQTNKNISTLNIRDILKNLQLLFDKYYKYIEIKNYFLSF